MLLILSLAAVVCLVIAQLGSSLEFALFPAPNAWTGSPKGSTDLAMSVVWEIGTILGVLLTLGIAIIWLIVVLQNQQYVWLLAVFGSGLLALAGVVVPIGASLSGVPSNSYNPFDALLIVPIGALIYTAFVAWVLPAEGANRRRRLWKGVATVFLLGLVVAGGVVRGAVWLADNAGTTVPAATGSGPCGLDEAVSLRLVYSDGRTVQACTHDRPACRNTRISSSTNGQPVTEVSQFTLSNRLRGSSDRYSLYLVFDGPLAAETPERSLIATEPTPPGSGPVATTATSAFLNVSSGSSDGGFGSASGSVTVSSSHGVAKGRIDVTVAQGGSRPDRPPPPQTPNPPAQIRGTFACTQDAEALGREAWERRAASTQGLRKFGAIHLEPL